MTQWRKSSYSGATQGTDCVELAAFTERVGIRDSKAPEAGQLTIDRGALARLIGGIKAGELDL
jgi:hypothetical protein